MKLKQKTLQLEVWEKCSVSFIPNRESISLSQVQNEN